ncbi:WxL domain-containing protein [Latilactobacillus sp. 5-91]|uniref:WxL domain-containing protein n=1 Tax=Latilactobacillus sp. 5-91 TaxID=3410924 RepID=UPI003C737FB0
MKKRSIYFLMTAFFILTTIIQTVVPIYAQGEATNSSSHLSKVIDYQKALASTSSAVKTLSSNQEQATTVSQSTSEEKQSTKETTEKSKQAKTSRSTRATAIQATDIDDGITGWIPGPGVAALGFKKFTQKTEGGLQYTFGSITTAQDPRLETTGTTGSGLQIGYTSIRGGQMNVAIARSSGSRKIADLTNIYYGSVQTGLTDDGSGGPTYNLGFGIVFDPNDAGKWGPTVGPTKEPSGYMNGQVSILANKLTDKVYYTKLGANNSSWMKVMGYFTRVDSKNKTHKYLVEILMAPTPGDTPGVQQELYVKNISGQTDNFGILLGGVTRLALDDGVPVKSIGNDQGLYIEGKDAEHKVLMKMAVPDGPDDFGSPNLPNGYTNVFNSYDGKNFAGNGAKRNGKTKTPNTVIDSSSRTSYSAKWDFKPIANGETRHFRQDMIGMTGPIVVPTTSKTWTNKTATDGMNHVGDKGQYKIVVTNTGYQDSWKGVKIIDQPISDYLSIDDQSIKLTLSSYDSTGNKTEYVADVPASAYDQTKKTITIEPGQLKTTDGKAVPADLGDNSNIEVTFDVKIKSNASKQTVKNHVDVTGSDSGNSNAVISDSADSEFDVEEVKDPTSMTKLVRNVSKDSQSTFAATTDAGAGDHVQYQIETTVSPNTDLTGGIIQDKIDSNLSVTKTQVQYQQTDDSWGALTDATWDASHQLTLPSPVSKGKKVRIIIDATVGNKVTDGQVINNTAELVAGSYGIGTTPDADAKVTVTDKHALEKDSLHQYIKNLTQKDTSDTLDKTTGYANDKIQYTFTGKSDAGNTEKLAKLAVDQIKSAPASSLVYVDDSLKINGTAATAAVQQAFKDGNYTKISALDELAKDTQFTITYEMTVKDNADQTITNDAWLTATKLDGSVAIDATKPDATGLKFNTTTLTVKKLNLTMTKQVGLYNGSVAPTTFADSVEARPGQKVQYQINITPDTQKVLSDITVEDVLDSSLDAPTTVSIKRQKADGSWGAEESVAIDATTGRIKIPNNDTTDYKGWKQLQITMDATVKANVVPATKVKIDNQASIVAGSYGVGQKSNVATITLLDKLEVTGEQILTNLSTGDGPTLVVFAGRGDIIEYSYKVNVPSSNTASLDKLVIKNIKLNQSGVMKLVDGSLKITKNGNANSDVDNTAQEKNLKDNAQIALADAAPGTNYVVTYQMQFVVSTYRGINNSADLGATKLDNAQDPVNAPNVYKTKASTVVMSDKPQATVKQEVTNATYPTSDNTNKTETAAKVGDKLHYTFQVTAKGKLTNVSIKDIIQNPSGLMDYDANSLKVTLGAIGGTPINVTTTTSGFPDNGLVQIGAVEANQVLTVSYDRTLTDYDVSHSAYIENAGKVVADRLAATDPNAPIEDVENNQIPFNTTKVNIKTKQQVSVYSDIKNETKPDKDWQGKTEGSKDDLIGYRFIINANSKNNADVKNVKLTNIALDPAKDSKSGDMLSYVPNSFSVAVNGKVDSGATFSDDHTEVTLSQPLKRGQMAVVLYQMKVNTEDIDIPVKNHATLSADRLTDVYGDALKDASGVAITTAAAPDTTLNLKLGKSQTVIRYVDMDKVTSGASEQDQTIAPTETAIGKIGEPFSKGIYVGGSKDGTTVGDDRVAPKVIDGYTIIAVSESDDIINNPGWAKAYKDDPLFTKDGRTITYGYRKRMISIEAPTYWDFGERNRSQTDSTYYLEELKEPQKVQVTDNYGVQSWQLQVAQKAPFIDDRKQELKDAELQFRNGTLSADPNNTTPTQAMSTVDHFDLKPGDTVKNLMTYKKSGVFQADDASQDKSSETNPYSDDQGKGTWTYTFGNKQNAGISIGLYVPATTKRDNTTYTTTLDWSLTVAP